MLKSGAEQTFGFLQVTHRALASAICALALTACNGLPAGGPSTASFENADLSAPSTAQDGFMLIDLSPKVVDLLASRGHASLNRQFGGHSQVGNGSVGSGDTIEITIWEASSGGLFSSAGDQITTGSRSVTLPAQEVDRGGSITVPYAGRITVAGLTTAQIENKIVLALAEKAIEPQAIVTLRDNKANAVTVAGEGIRGARIALSQRGERLLDVLAEAGGTNVPPHEAMITLSRAGRSVSVPLITIVANPAENILMRRGDTLTVLRDPQNFTALGATGKNTIVPFDEPTITLEKAVAKAGGLSLSNADPAGVFLLRREPVSLAKSLDPSFPLESGQQAVNVVYRANLRDPNSLFLAHRFPILPDDILYVSGAPSNDLERFLRLVGLSLGTARSAAAAF